jgi:hypothetical protein
VSLKVTLVAGPMRQCAKTVQVKTLRMHKQKVCLFRNNTPHQKFAAVCEESSNACPEKGVPNKTTEHRLLKICRDTGSVCL